jgi:hypothetical protein
MFQCPVCAHPRSRVIPAFSADLREFETAAAVSRVTALWEDLLGQMSGTSAADVLAGHIVLLEARVALRPEILDAEEVRALYRNLFLSAALLRARATRVGHASGATPLARVICAAVIAVARDRGTPLSFAKIAAGVKDARFSFWRQLALFGFFMGGIPIGDPVDWDAALDPGAIARIFGLKGPLDLRYVPVRTVDLADDWVDLLADPFNYDIVTMTEDTAVCLLTGQRLTLSGVMADADKVTIIEHARVTFKGGAVLVLHLTGREATKISFASSEFNVYMQAANAWVDQLGMPDVGIRQGRLLSLNRSVLAEIVDDFLSGKFNNNLR